MSEQDSSAQEEIPTKPRDLINQESSRQSERKYHVSSSQNVSDMIEGVNSLADDNEVNQGHIESQEEKPEFGNDQEQQDNETKEAQEQDNQDHQEQEDEKNNIQKRIDALLAEKKNRDEQIERLRKEIQQMKDDSNVDKDDNGQPKRYSNDELTKALNKFIEEGNAQGINEVMDVKIQYLKEDLMNAYDEDKQRARKEQENVIKERNEQWLRIKERFSNYEDEALSSNADFDINNTQGKLYKLAKTYYEDHELSGQYSGRDGMERAVQDAYDELLIMGEHLKKSDNSGSKKSLNIDAKNIRKRSLSRGADESSHEGARTAPKEYSAESELSQVLEERSKFKRERTSTGVI